MDLALLVDHQAVHVLVGGDIDRATIDFRPGGEGVEEHLVTAFNAVAVDQFQRLAIEGGNRAAHGVDHQVTIEGHAHAKGGVHRDADATLGLLVVEQLVRQLGFTGELHARRRIFRVVLVDAKYPAGTGTNEGVVTGQHRVDRTAQQLVGGAAQHAVGLRRHVVQQAFFILGFEKLAGFGRLLQALLRADRLVVGQFHRQVDAGDLGEFEVVFDLQFAQGIAGPEPVQIGTADLVGVLDQAARFIRHDAVGVRRDLVGAARDADIGTVRGGVVPVRLVVVGLRQVRVGRCNLSLGHGQGGGGHARCQQRPVCT
ncbi:hypothetical protein D3C85_1098930 [compost metagenome]